MPTKMEPTFRRKHIRIEPKAGQPIQVNINGEDFIDITNAVDISLGGVGLKVPHEFKGCELARQVSFIIDLPTEPKKQCVQVHGRILHVSGQRFGVSFTDMSKANRQKIKKYIGGRIKEESWFGWVKYSLTGLMNPAF